MTKLLAFSIGDPGSSMTITNLPSGVSGIVNDPNILSHALTLIFQLVYVLAIVYAIVYFVLGAWHMITSQGDKKEIEAARTYMTNAILGMVVVFVSFLLISLLGNWFHINLFQVKLIQ